MVEPKHTALLIIDVQNDFFHGEGALGRREGDISPIQRAVPPLVRFLAEARQVGLPIIFVRAIHSQGNDPPVWVTEFRSACGVEPKVICREGTWGAEYYRVQPTPGELQIAKHRYNAFHDTDLDIILRSRGIRSLILTGSLTDVAWRRRPGRPLCGITTSSSWRIVRALSPRRGTRRPWLEWRGWGWWPHRRTWSKPGPRPGSPRHHENLAANGPSLAAARNSTTKPSLKPRLCLGVIYLKASYRDCVVSTV